MQYEHTLKDGTVIQLRQIGKWTDLAKYFEGSDGNAWSYGVTGYFVNCGPIDAFRANFEQRYRGELTS